MVFTLTREDQAIVRLALEAYAPTCYAKVKAYTAPLGARLGETHEERRKMWADRRDHTMQLVAKLRSAEAGLPADTPPALANALANARDAVAEAKRERAKP